MAAERVESIVEALRGGDGGDRPVPAFHWEVEFPEVFDRENAGFDAFVGNPPFAGKNTISQAHHKHFPAWLSTFPGSHGNADLVVYFFRRCFEGLHSGGTLGMIATNTIAQGDTRRVGLAWVAEHGGTIFNATRRRPWPGAAAVIVSIVHVSRGMNAGSSAILDGAEVGGISAYLVPGGFHQDPNTLASSEGMAFTGPIVLGMGFTFDDQVAEATPVSEMKRIIGESPECAPLIHPYIGGEELLNAPDLRHRRYVIAFGDRSEAEAKDFRPLFEIVERRVKPARAAITGTDGTAERRRTFWWQWGGGSTPALFAAMRGLDRLLMVPFTASNLCFAFVPSSTVIAGPHVAIALSTNGAFCSLQCRAHEVWVRFFSSSMKDDLRYSLSDCFVTFPFPRNWQSDPTLESAGQLYYDFRAAVMIRNDEGLTTIYNRFHDPDERAADILRLRELHADMDRAVLDAYGWKDLPTACDFLLDWEDPEDDADDGGPRRKKKPWRYRWPDDVRDEVLARLLELNRQRAEEERLATLTGNKPPSRPKATPKPKPSPKSEPSPPKNAAPERAIPGGLFGRREDR